MMNKVLNDFKTPKNRYPIHEELHSRQLGYYYFVFEEDRVSAGKDQALIKRFDENGIPVNKTYIDVTDKDYVYFPISIGQMGLSIFHSYLKTQSDGDRQRFLKFADWFYHNAEEDEKLGIRWLTDVALPQYKNPGPWQSAFSQSRGLSILLRAYQLTNDESFAAMARKALISFTWAVEKGGVTSYTNWGPFYEEYTASVPTLVLNGMIFALFGVYDFVRVFPDDARARKIFDDGVETLVQILPQYDLGFWSRYNLCKANWYPKVDPSTLGYQRLHVAQLKVMYALTNQPVFKTYADRFLKQENIFNMMRMYIVKYKALKKIGRV